jgi:hypothetical protein
MLMDVVLAQLLLLGLLVWTRTDLSEERILDRMTHT